VTLNTTALIILAEGFEEIEAVTPIDLLRRAQIGVTIAGLSGLWVRGGHDSIIQAEVLLSQCDERYDALILPGGGAGTENLRKSAAVVRRVKEHFNKGLLCAAICAAPTVFGVAGILRGKHATCYPGCEDLCTDAIMEKSAVVKDGNIITSRGAGTAIDFSLEIISYLKAGGGFS
jgi:4-methyl-5(b-hydroxyethyl)-thiazole monophosphate biosynthesis